MLARVGRTFVISFRPPSQEEIARFLERLPQQQLSYTPIGLSLLAPNGFRVDVHRAVLGHGHDVFDSARAALGAWEHFNLGWVTVFPKNAPIRVGVDVAVVARHLGLCSLNGCRIVSVREGPHAFAFAYGTLDDHVERGEEVFAVVLDEPTGGVHYEVRAVSQQCALLARLASPLARRLQDRFRRDSASALLRAVERDGGV